MFEQHLSYLACPVTGEKLQLGNDIIYKDNEIIEGSLSNESNTYIYSIKDGIPRFYSDHNYNKCWDYKWRVLDAGKGLNYLIADKEDPAYKIHDLFDRNSYNGEAHKAAKNSTCLEIGCGIGQYTYRLLSDYSPNVCIAIDLTNSGVETFRKVMLEKYPQFREKLLIIQGNAHMLPIKTNSIDYVLSLGVLHHTGDTEMGVNEALRVCKEQGTFNLWIYASDIVPIEIKEEKRNIKVNSPMHYFPTLLSYAVIMFWLKLFRRISMKWKIRIINFFSSEFYYKCSSIRFIRFLPNLFFPVVHHPNKEYRRINIWDGYSNDYQDTFCEKEFFEMVKKFGGRVKSFSDWRLGVWGTKR